MEKNNSIKNLNSEQQKAVMLNQGPILVVAGAGTGKTGVIVNRIKYLLEQSIEPHTIVALTFTNKAAGEMKERLAAHLAHAQTKPFIGTFHAYCLQILKQNRHLLAYPSFTILDSEDQEKMIQTIIKRSNIDKKVNPKTIAHNISLYKNGLVTEHTESLFVDPLFRELVAEYQKEKNAQHCFDFDDLLLEVVKLFEKNTLFKEQHQKTIRHILVDEYQDTNAVQQILLKHMTLEQSKQHFAIDSLCAVGDPDQSIYSWRGATIKNILDFPYDFKDTQTVEIKQNYRCDQSILDVANALIVHNRYRTAKALWSTKKGSDRVRVLHCLSGFQESNAIAEGIRTFQRKNRELMPSIAILYRAHYQSRLIEEALIKNSILYRIIGGIEFYARKEIKDLLAYLRLIVNPFDRISLFRVINCPTRGLGEKFQELLYTTWQDNPFYTFEQAIEHILAQSQTHKTLKLESLQAFLNIMQHTKTLHGSVHKALLYIVEATNYYTYLNNSFDKDEAESKIDNVKELLRATEHFEKEKKHTIDIFLEEVALMQQHETADDASNPVLLMSIHAAKGLEFDMVIIAGLEENIFPSARSTVSSELLEEERRLLYVAITRAKEYVLMIHAKNRASFGSVTDQLPSRFLSEIDEPYASRHSALYWSQYQIQSFFQQWFGMQSSRQIYTVPSAKAVHAVSEQPPTPLPKDTEKWRLNQKVIHGTFGTGTIIGIEKKDTVNIFLSVLFGSEIKKIKDSFIKPL